MSNKTDSKKVNVWDKSNKERAPTMTLKEALTEDSKEILNELINEAVEHFIGTRSREIEDDARYFIGNDERAQFFKRYKEEVQKKINKGEEYSDLNTLHIGIVEELSTYTRPYYEICRKKYYEDYPDYFWG